MCALEAMALGVPIVSTPTDGLCELIADGENGYLSDVDEVLSKCITELISNPLMRKQFSDHAKAVSIEINNKEAYKNTILECYKMK